MGDISLGRSIRKRRDSLGLSQARLAELVGRSATTIRNWERDKSSPSDRADVVALAAVLGLDESETLAQAGFETQEATTHVTMEESYSSLGPVPPVATAPPDTEPEYTEPEDVEPAADPEPADTESAETDPEPADAELAEDTEPAGESRPTESDRTDDPEIEESTPDGDTFAEFFRSETAHRSPDPDEADAPSSEAEPDRGRRLRRAAPPTVLESAPVGEPSYLEVPEERQRYRMRALVTAIAVVGLVFVLLWSFDRATDALAGMWNEFFSVLDF